MLRVLACCLVLGGLGVAAVAAHGTPGAGVSGPITARGSVGETIVIGVPTREFQSKRVRVRVRGRTYTRRVRVRVKTVRPLISCRGDQRCDIAFQQLTVNPGGHTGWHTHPGPTFVAVTEGEGTLYHAGAAGTPCMSHKYGALNGFFQPSADVHTFRNETAARTSVMAFYILPRNTPNTGIRVDQPQPANCPNIP